MKIIVKRELGGKTSIETNGSTTSTPRGTPNLPARHYRELSEWLLETAQNYRHARRSNIINQLQDCLRNVSTPGLAITFTIRN